VCVCARVCAHARTTDVIFLFLFSVFIVMVRIQPITFQNNHSILTSRPLGLSLIYLYKQSPEGIFKIISPDVMYTISQTVDFVRCNGGIMTQLQLQTFADL
jgi:hypothetical protein